MTLVSIVIPTFRRPLELRRLLSSVQYDLGIRNAVAIIVVDNDSNQTALPVIEEFRERLHAPIEYHLVDEPGVSNVRNAGMKAVNSRFVLFLDDDMETVSPYLQTLLDTADQLKTTITFGASVAKLPDEKQDLSNWLVPLYSRVFEDETGIVTDTLGTGGSLIDLQNVALPSPPFDPALNEVGGEDDAFFAHIISQGGLVGWCAEAVAWEHVPVHRTQLSYLWARQFAFGQSPTRDAADRGLKGVPEILKWTGVGFVQAFLHGSLFIVTSMTRRKSSFYHFGRTAQGVGKMFWWDQLSPRLYGHRAR